jgi:hypothetical protein
MPWWWFYDYNTFINNPSTIYPESLTLLEKVRQLELKVAELDTRVKALEDKKEV